MTKASPVEISVSCMADAGAGPETPLESPAQAPALPKTDRSAMGLWLWVSAGFLLLVIVWTILFTVARSAKIETIPVPTQGGKARASERV